MRAGRPEAVVFDFDGLLVDTEWSIFELAVTAFADFGITLSIEAWSKVVGLAGEDDWWGQLCRANGWTVDREAWWARYNEQDRSHRDHLPAQPGVVALLDGCAAAGVPVAIASSSGIDWIGGHLDRLGLRGRFASIAGVDRTGVGKPAPDVYLLACKDLDADPARSVALEDSAPGIAAAKAAGMACVAVPSRITRLTDLSAADLSVASLADLTVPLLAALVPPA